MDGLRLARAFSSSPSTTRGRTDAHSPVQVRAGLSRAAGGSTLEAVPPTRQMRRLWTRKTMVEQCGDEPAMGELPRGNWVMKILQVRWLREEGEKERKKGGGEEVGGDRTDGKMDEADRCVGCIGCGSDGCDVSEEGEAAVEFDRELFSRFLQKVSLVEAKLYAKMSYLGALAYNIPKIKPANLLKFHKLRFVTSSLAKKAKSVDVDKKEASALNKESEEVSSDSEETMKPKKNGSRISQWAVYSIAASAAAYIQSRTRGILHLNSQREEITKESHEGCSGNGKNHEIANSTVASFMAAADSVTAVVTAEEEIKQAVAKDLSSARSPPCEWFICDDDGKGTRYFIIQGSESLASWQANLLFEPIQFEGLDVLVHRGIYEVAKGIYKQILPEIHAHLKSHGNSATFRFTGHSLGGSLSVLVNLMLLIRGEVPLSSLLPVITFGAPCILCGGDNLLRQLGLPQNHVQAIMMHRDIVPRAFSCNYPDHVAQILKAINGRFRNHPCLKNQKLLYAPLGELLILQPEEKYSPFHHLLPSCSGLYILGHSLPEHDDLLQAARSTFLNSPHPLEILSNRTAYSARGTVTRNHQVLAYLRSLYNVVHQEIELIKKAKSENQGWLSWPLSDGGFHARITMGWQSRHMAMQHLGFSRVANGGRKTLKRLRRLVASRHANMLVVLFLPAQCLFFGMLAAVSLHG